MKTRKNRRVLWIALALVCTSMVSGCAHCHGSDWLVAPLAAYVIVDFFQHCCCH